MRMLTRSVSVLTVLGLLGTAALPAQEQGGSSFRWYVGPQIGLLSFETPAQTRGFVFTGGGHVMITAKRTGLLISVDEAFTTKQLSAYSDASAPGGVRTVTFNDLRRYQAVLLGFPFRGHAQPFLGVGFGMLMTVHEYPSTAGLTTNAEIETANSTANSLGSYGFGTILAGVQVSVSRITVFGHAQISTAPDTGKLLSGISHGIVGGIRIDLGSAREGVSGGGY
jgi:hypothetical protein